MNKYDPEYHRQYYLDHREHINKQNRKSYLKAKKRNEFNRLIVGRLKVNYPDIYDELKEKK
jgi:hypothetical protein